MKELIPADEFCVNHHIGISFIHSLQDSGLIEITTVEETEYIRTTQLKELESIVRWHYDLDINLEGIETIHHLLTRMNGLQDEIITLRNRLRFYEPDEEW